MKSFRRLAEEKGLKETLMLDVANDLKISKKTIYKFFASKDEMVAELVRNFIADIQALIHQPQNSKRNPFEKLIRIYAAVNRYIVRIPPQLLSDIQSFHPKLWDMIEESREQQMNVFVGIIEEGIRSGVFKPVNATVAIRMITASINAVINPKFLHGHRISFAEGLNNLQTIIIEGLKR
jgi:AcrR family transcriptional regulator